MSSRVFNNSSLLQGGLEFQSKTFLPGYLPKKTLLQVIILYILFLLSRMRSDRTKKLFKYPLVEKLHLVYLI